MLATTFMIPSNGEYLNETPLFIESNDDASGKTLIVEEDQYSIWAYILTDQKDGIDFDGFLCSRIDPMKHKIDPISVTDQGGAPPIFPPYSNEFSFVAEVNRKDVEIRWGRTQVEVYLKGVKYLVMDFENKKSYSKAIGKDGPFGGMLIE